MQRSSGRIGNPGRAVIQHRAVHVLNHCWKGPRWRIAETSRQTGFAGPVTKPAWKLY
jgi:hypothetical protein